MGIARNQIGTYLRERKRNRLVFDAETIDVLAVAFEQMESEQTRNLDYLQECMAKMDGRARQLCTLRYQNDLKPAAIASILGMTANTVAKSLQRIRDQLRQCIQRHAALDGVNS
jgi:RNA polymerase sigma-70 factor (ECF subfamily)